MKYHTKWILKIWIVLNLHFNELFIPLYLEKLEKWWGKRCFLLFQKFWRNKKSCSGWISLWFIVPPMPASHTLSCFHSSFLVFLHEIFLTVCKWVFTDKSFLPSISSAQRPKNIAGILKDSIPLIICKYLHLSVITSFSENYFFHRSQEWLGEGANPALGGL